MSAIILISELNDQAYPELDWIASLLQKPTVIYTLCTEMKESIMSSNNSWKVYDSFD